MRVVIQRVTSASVRVRNPVTPEMQPNTSATRSPQVEGNIVSSIGPGLLCLVGIKDTDTEKDAEYWLKKAKPDFSKAMPPSQAKEFYQQFVDRIKQAHGEEKVKDGVFGAMMDVSLINDGPVTFIVDTDMD